MKRKSCKHWAMALAVVGMAWGLTACQSRGGLETRLVGQFRDTISSILESSKDKKAGKEALSGEDSEEKNTEDEALFSENEEGKRAAETEQEIAQEAAQALPQELGVYLVKPSPYPGIYWTTPAVETKCDTVHADKKAYPELSHALEAYNAEGAAIAAAWENENQEAAETEQAAYGNSYLPYTFKRDLLVMRADQHGVGIFCEDNRIYGGAAEHWETTFSGKNFDPLTGKELALEDVVVGIAQLQRALVEEFCQQKEKDIFTSSYMENAEEMIVRQFEENQPGENQPIWVLGYQGITFYYHVGVISYGRGGAEITLLYEKYPELFKAPYQKEPEEFALSDKWGNWKCDLNHDGELENISVFDGSNGYMGNTIQFFINNREYLNHSEEYISLLDKYLLKNKDGNFYIYLTTSEVDELNRVLVFKLTENNVTYQGEVYGWIDSPLISRPSHFDLGRRIGVLGNRNAYQHYSMGNDGLPVAEEEIYYFHGWEEDDLGDTILENEMDLYRVTTNMPVSAWRILEDGTVSSTTEDIPAGVSCLPIRTDEKTFVDIQTMDGKRWRIDYHIDESGWMRTIWGVDENEVFSGIVYAG